MPPIVIVGAGLAGWTLVRELRKLNANVPVTVIAADAGDFYGKPMLSNALAQGKQPDALVATPATEMARQTGVTLLPRTRVDAIHPPNNTLQTSAGALAYSKLILALGADPIRLPLAGDAAEDVLSINDLDDYRRFRTQLEEAGKPRRVAIIGAGLIGCEFANDLLGAGHTVSVFDPAPWPLASLLPELAGRQVESALAGAGARWRLGRGVQAVDHQDNDLTLTLDNGEREVTDIVLSAVGLRPRTALARAAGLAVGRGVSVSTALQTSEADVFALGDCAEIDGRVLPYVTPIMHAARALARTLAGTPTAVSFPPMPVLVKTPACPVAVVPVARDAAGTWQTETSDGNICMRFHNAEGRLAGFALAGTSAAAGRAALTKELAG